LADPGRKTRDRELPPGVLGSDRAHVRAFHAAALDAGAEILNGAAHLSGVSPDYYGAFVRDPDGHNIEALSPA